MKWVFLVVSAAAAAGAFSYGHLLQEEWNDFKLKHNKQYASAEEERERMKVYAANKHEVAQHNERYSLGLTTFKLGLNEFSDRFPSEIERMYEHNHDVKAQAPHATDHSSTFISPANAKYADYVNWTANGAVTEVKDHGYCASSWAFATVGALEGQRFRKTGKLVSLSAQNLIDCSSSFGNNGCNFGMPRWSFNYIYYNRGIDTEKSYPYEGVSYLCRYNPKTSNATDKGYIRIVSGDELKLKAAVATVGPIAARIYVTPTLFSRYRGGLYYDVNCKSNVTNYAVLVVGYGTNSEGIPYWLIKNSYGKSWGIGGYMMLARNQNNHCGIALDASYPIV